METLSILVLAIFTVYYTGRLVTKAGYPGVLSALAYVPVVNFGFLLGVVFSKWPIESKLQRYRQLHGDLPPEDLEFKDAMPPEDPKFKDAMKTDVPCLQCEDGIIPVGSSTCRCCGWTYQPK